MLLDYGADPNKKVRGEQRNAILRPPLAELLASNDNVSCEEVRLLLCHGARVSISIKSYFVHFNIFDFFAQVVMKTQYRDPDGILNCLNKVSEESNLFELLIGAGEEFDAETIKRTNYLTDGQKEILIREAGIPRELKAQLRTFIKRKIGRLNRKDLEEFDLPRTLIGYLLYEYN